MSQPTSDSDYFTPPPQTRPYGAPTGWAPPAGTTGRAPPGEQKLATPARRLLARVVDTGIVGLLAVPFSAPLLSELLARLGDKVELASTTGSQPTLADATTIRLTLVLTAVVLAVSFVYEVPQLLRWGQTLGKRLCRVRVIRRDGGRSLGIGPVVLRWLTQAAAPQLPWIGPGIWLLDSLWLLWDRPWRQCLHDKVASTIVVTVP